MKGVMSILCSVYKRLLAGVSAGVLAGKSPEGAVPARADANITEVIDRVSPSPCVRSLA